MFRLLRDTDTTLRRPWLAEGTPTTGQTITVAVNDLDGVSVASGAAAEDGATGFYEFTLDQTEVPDVALLDTIWTNSNGMFVSERIEVVGNWLFTEPQARSFDNGALASTTDYTDVMILEERDRLTDLLENLTGRSWVPRYRRYTFRGTGTRELWIPDKVYSEGGGGGGGQRTDIATVLAANDGAVVTPSNIKVDKQLGVFYRTDATWRRPSSTDPYNATVDVEYGMPEVTDGVDWAALWLLRDRLVQSNIPDRAVSWTDEFGNINLDTMPTFARDWIKSHDFRIGVA